MNLRRHLREAIIAVALTVAVVLALTAASSYLESTYPKLNLTSAPE